MQWNSPEYRVLQGYLEELLLDYWSGTPCSIVRLEHNGPRQLAAFAQFYEVAHLFWLLFIVSDVNLMSSCMSIHFGDMVSAE